jgi:hypothetical protein
MLFTENRSLFSRWLAPAFWRGKDLGGGGRTGGFGELDFDSFGTALRFRVPNVDVDWGLYYHRFNDTSAQV